MIFLYRKFMWVGMNDFLYVWLIENENCEKKLSTFHDFSIVLTKVLFWSLLCIEVDPNITQGVESVRDCYSYV